MTTPTKTCRTCRRTMPRICFARHWKSVDGLRHECGDCFHKTCAKPHHLLADGHGDRCLCQGCDRRRRVLARVAQRIRREGRLLGEAI